MRNLLPSFSKFAVPAAIAAYFALSPMPAQAGCYGGLGCTDVNRFSQAVLRQQSCDFLYYLRNSVYKEHGYCFKTQRAIATFGNAGCYITDPGAVPLNSVEHYNVDAIKRAENWLGCR